MEKKTEKILLLFLLLQPIFDSAATLIPKFSIQLIGRGLFLVFILFLLLKNVKTRKISFVLLGVMLVYFLYQTLYLHLNILDAASAIFKLFYFIFIGIYFVNVKKSQDLQKVLCLVLVEYVGIYFCSYFFHFGKELYIKEVKKIGYKGVFNSVNEFSAILTILYYYMLYFFYKKPLVVVGISIPLFIVSFLTGTKVLFGFLAILLLGYFILQVKGRWTKWDKGKKIGLVCSLVALISLALFAFFHSNVYQNMVVQQKFFKVKNIFSLEYINRIVFNDRFSFFYQNIKYMLKEPLFSWALGIGYSNPLKLVEIDCFDILFRYGVVGLGIVIWFFAFLFRHIKKNYFELGAILILLCISSTSGHVLLSPAVSLYFGISLLLNQKNKKNEI